MAEVKLDTRTCFPPPEALKAKSYVPSWEDYLARYRASIEDPDGFWASEAEALLWRRRWDKVREGDLPEFRYFVGGLINACENCVDRHAQGPRKNKVALICEDEAGQTRTVTYGMLRDMVARLAGALSALGVGKGDMVALYMPNNLETYVATLACMRLGAVYNIIFAGMAVESVRSRIVDCGARIVLTADGFYRRGKLVPLKQILDQALEGLTQVERVVVHRRSGVSIPWVEGRDVDWDQLLAQHGRPVDPVPCEANDWAFVVYTSGSTGKPKGLVHAVGSFLVLSVAATRYSLDLNDEDVYWCTADIGWLTAPIYVLWGGLALGATCVLYEGAPDYPGPDRVYRIMQRYGVNKFFSAPTLFRVLARDGDRYVRQFNLNLELIASIGEPLNPEAWYWAYEVLGKKRAAVVNIYGQTETSGCGLSGFPAAVPMKPGSCGVPFFGHVVDVVDSQGRTCPPGTAGYLVYRTPTPGLARTILGDHPRFLKTYYSLHPGMYFTGDAAMRDEDGHFWVLGRVDDVINVAGHRISTMELESCLSSHPAVAEAAVVGISDEIKGMVPVAFAVLRPGFTPGPELAEELREKVAREIGAYARPAQVRFVPGLPRTRSGKIMRRLLREILTQGEVRSDISTLEDLAILEHARAAEEVSAD